MSAVHEKAGLVISAPQLGSLYGVPDLIAVGANMVRRVTRGELHCWSLVNNGRCHGHVSRLNGPSTEELASYDSP
jgi:hypothetical protein